MNSSLQMSAKSQPGDRSHRAQREARPFCGINKRIEFRQHPLHQIAMARRGEFRHARDDAAEQMV